MKIIGKRYIAVITALVIACSAISVSISTLAANDVYGTEADGITDALPGSKPILDGFDNFDFSQGYKYWGSACAQASEVKSQLPKKVTSLKKYSNGNQLKLNYDGDSWKGIKTVKFYVDASKLTEGAYLTAMMEYKGNVPFTVGITQWELGDDGTGYKVLANQNVKQSGGHIVTASSKNGWNVAYTNAHNLVTLKDYTPDDGKIVLQVYVQRTGDGSNLTVDDATIIRNIRLVIAKSGKWYDLEGNEIDPKATLYGSESEGITDALPGTKKTLEKFTNLDFSEGYKYWGTAKTNASYVTTQSPSKVTALNGNELTMEYDSADEWKGISTVKFYVDSSNIKVGDNITALVEWKGNVSFTVAINQWDIDNEKGFVQLAASDVIKDGRKIVTANSNDDWNLSCSNILNTVALDKTDDGKIVLTVGVQTYGNAANAKAGDTVTVRNIRLVKMNDGGKTAYDLNSNSITTMEKIDNLTEKAGSFIPYGMFKGADGKYITKNDDGSFYNVPANSVYTEYTVPKTVTTFGTSMKEGATNVPQFGSYAQKAEDVSFGTMSLVGDIDDFMNSYSSVDVSTLMASVSKYYDRYEAKMIENGNTHVILPYGSEGKQIKIFKTPQKKFMWQNSDYIQYALRINGLQTGEQITAIGYRVNGTTTELSTEIQTYKAQ